MPGALALGSLTFTMTALPGSPQVQNTIPMQYFGTDSFAAPVLGIVAAIIMLGCGMLWLNGRVKRAKAAGEGYGDEDNNVTEIVFENPPNIIIALLPIVIILAVNLFFSKVYYVNCDASYLESYSTTISAVSGTWSVLLGMIFSIIFLFAVNLKRYKNIKENMKDAAASCLLPLVNSCAVVGFGSVIKGLAVFAIVQSFVLGLSSNLLVSEFLAVSLLCGMMASASGGLGVTLEALAPTYLEMASQTGISAQVLHRVASVASGGLDSLPHNGATVTILALCKKTHKESYLDMFMVSVVFPLIASVVIIILASIGLAF